MSFTASNGDDLFEIFYPLVPGATQVTADTKFLSGAQDLRYIFRSVVDGLPGEFDTGYSITQTGSALDLRYVFARIGSISTPTPTPSPTPSPTTTPTFTTTNTNTPTPTHTVTPTTSSTPIVTCAVSTGSITIGGNYDVESAHVDQGTGITPSEHGLEYRFDPSVNPTGSYSALHTFTTPTAPTSPYREFNHEPDNTGRYQYRAYADYGYLGRIYSNASTVVRVLTAAADPTVSISVSPTTINYGTASTTLQSTADDGGTGITPTTHNFEYRYSASSNPPTGGWTQIQNFTPSSPDDTRSISYTPDQGPGYYQFRSTANYGAEGLIVSDESQVLHAQAVTPSISLSINSTNIFYGDSVILGSVADDNGSGVVPGSHGFEVRQGATNPPGGAYSNILNTVPSTPDDTISNHSYTPNLGAGYYQFRAYANYAGTDYFSNEQVVFAQAPQVPTFEFTNIFCLAATRYDANNGMHVGFINPGTSNVTITIDPGDASETYPVIVAGDLVQDFITSSGTRTYTMSIGGGAHTIIVDSRSFGPNIISIDVQHNSGAKFTNGSGRCLRTADNGMNLVLNGMTAGSKYTYRSRNCTTGTNVDSGEQTATGTINIGAESVSSPAIYFIEVLPSGSGHSAPSLSPTTQEPFDLSGAYTTAAGWVRDVGFQQVVYDGRISYSEDEHSFILLKVENNANVNFDSEMGSSKGIHVGCWVDLQANGAGGSGGSNPHSVIFFNADVTIDRDQESGYHWSQYDVYSQAGVKADYWWQGVTMIKDRNNPDYGWFFPSSQGGSGFPFSQYNFDSFGSGNTISRYRESGPSSPITSGPGFTFPQTAQPKFTEHGTGTVYGRIPSNCTINIQVGGRIKSSPYRNAAIWISQIH